MIDLTKPIEAVEIATGKVWGDVAVGPGNWPDDDGCFNLFKPTPDGWRNFNISGVHYGGAYFIRNKAGANTERPIDPTLKAAREWLVAHFGYNREFAETRTAENSGRVALFTAGYNTAKEQLT